jgi:iron complex outermembrane recepter protein
MRNNQLRLAVRAALAAGALATAVAAPSAFAQEAAADLDRVQVTGSRIKRTDIEGALPVTVIDRETIELSGFTSVADILRNTPFNSQGSFRPQSGSSAQSWAGLSLRGLGEGRTLILVDGRRAPVAPNVGGAQDLNAIPLAAVERIEILTDGASAVYGSDAIGGVVNIITRKDFSGVELMYGFGDPAPKGGDTEEGSVIMGISGEKGRLMAGASYNNRDIVFQRDRAWSSGGASVFSNNFAPANDSPGSLYGFAPGAFLAHPTFGSIVPGDGCTGPGFSSSDIRCFYDFTALAADEASIKNESLFARGSYDINMDWSLYMGAGVSRVTSFGRYAPVPSSPWPGGQPFIPVGSPNHPANPNGFNAGNTADYDPTRPVFVRHRFAALGPRDSNTDANVYDLNVGAEGRYAGFDIDFGLRSTESQFNDLGRNYVVGPIAQSFIESGRYNIYDPFSVDAATANSMIATISRSANYRLREGYANAATDLFEMTHGTVQIAFGGEYRDEQYEDLYDSLSEGGQIVGSAGNSAGGGRYATAFFVEALFPLLPDLDVTLAARYDDYSDYGSDTSPKISFRWQPLAELTFRGSYGEGFAAPSLDILTAQPTFSANGVIDPQTNAAFGVAPGTSTQVTNWVISNPNLDSENSEQFSLGVAYEPFDWLSGSLDWYSIEIDGRIAAVGPQQLVNCDLGTTQNCPPGLSVLPANVTPPQLGLGLGVARDPNDGSIVYLQRGFTNLGTLETDGLDLNLTTNFNFGEWGRVTNDLLVSYVSSYKIDGSPNLAGDASYPEFRAILANQYTYGDFVFAWNINWIASQDGTFADPQGKDTPSWVTNDVQANWFAPWNGRVTLGATNVFDKEPPIDFGFGRGYNFDLYNGYGRLVYARYTQNF